MLLSDLYRTESAVQKLKWWSQTHACICLYMSIGHFGLVYNMMQATKAHHSEKKQGCNKYSVDSACLLVPFLGQINVQFHRAWGQSIALTLCWFCQTLAWLFTLFFPPASLCSWCLFTCILVVTVQVKQGITHSSLQKPWLILNVVISDSNLICKTQVSGSHWISHLP